MSCEAHTRSGGKVRLACEGLLIKLFVDSVWIHRFWGCHRISERCFFVRGRQFHICARCTGLLVGIPSSLLLIPLRHATSWLFWPFTIALVVDGVTQSLKWRKSNNTLRFFTGLGAAATTLPFLIQLTGLTL
jgi:uncharacterized membrane protein